MNITVYQGINNVPQDIWDQVTVGHPFSGWQWCKFNEAIRHPHLVYYIIALSDDDNRPIAGAQFSVSPEEFIPLDNAFAHRIVASYIKKHPFVMSYAKAVTGFKGLYLPEDTALRQEFLKHAAEAGQKIAREHDGSFVIFSYLEDELDEPGWNGAVRLKDYMSPSTRLAIQWETYDQYLQHLNQKRRKNIRRNKEAAAEAGIVLECHSRVTDIDRAAQLIHNIPQHYRIQPDVTARPILENANLLPEYVWLTATYEDRLVGCEILTYDRQTGFAAPIAYGRDYSVDYVYFVMYYREIELAIEQFNASVLIGDSEAYNAKRRMGFEEEQRNNLCFYPVSPISRLLFALFKGMAN